MTYTDQSLGALEDRRLVDGAKAGLSKTVVTDAIHRRCLECSYDPLLAGTKYEQIAGCQASHCSLFPFRINADARPLSFEVVNPKDSKNWQRKESLLSEHQEKATPRDAVAAYCIDCNFAAAEPGNWRDQIRACGQKKCDLWMVRPT